MTVQKATSSLVLGLVVFVFLFSACSTVPPLDEYALARTALEAARDKDAARYAPSYWHRAEEFYRKGESRFRDEEYEEAEKDFRDARAFAEKAENTARLQKHKSGEVVP